jgi:YesN/AraC family two-component response regulator
VVLPVRQEAESKDPAIRQTEAGEKAAETRPLESPAEEEERVSILLVEDNLDVRTYVRSCLEDKYVLWEARNGQEGIDMAIEQVPDLVVSDVMMPEKDGFELCESLKSDIRTSHIPIVLLTAKADQESRISGLRYGADAYLAKPFNREELEVRLEQLLENRRKLQERFRHADSGEGAEDEAIRQEDAFLTRVREQLEENLDDENLGISGLARAIGVSRAQLHNKIKALTGQSPSVFVRTIRLRKARHLLLTTDLNVTQVAYEVGFRDPAYFSRTFSEEYGHSPKETRSADS